MQNAMPGVAQQVKSLKAEEQEEQKHVVFKEAVAC